MVSNKKTKKYYSPANRANKSRSFNSKDHSTLIRKIILAVIILAFLSVGVAAICSLVFTPERVTKSYLSDLASDYYEKYYYDKLVENSNKYTSTDFNTMMEKNSKRGFANVSLRQLILHNQDATDKINYILKYCDENSTEVIFYPDSPYERTSYHTEFVYSCAF